MPHGLFQFSRLASFAGFACLQFAIPARHASPPGNRLKAKPMADGQGEPGGRNPKSPYPRLARLARLALYPMLYAFSLCEFLLATGFSLFEIKKRSQHSAIFH
jgi:hypothetical protein